MVGRLISAVGCLAIPVLLLHSGGRASAAESRFAQTHSRSQYVHWIDLYDAKDHRIDPTDPNALPYSPTHTCGRCHDYEGIARGHHFNALDPEAPAGRPGEPWVWTDTRTGTQLPLSYRGWPGTYDPKKLDIKPWEFVMKFGHHLPGGGAGELPETAEASEEKPAETETGEKAEVEESKEADDEAPDRWHLSGHLSIDCMVCHSQSPTYSGESWWQQIEDENFAWAATAALGLGSISGKVSDLDDDFDPASVDENSRDKLPQTSYATTQMNANKKVFFDIIRKPHNNACYYCHTARLVGEASGPDWTYDEDVHVRAGMSCSDCHRNGIEHHMVRGFEGEVHPTGQPVDTLTCRGCHMDEHTAEGHHIGGRMGAPKPLHKGLPPLHLEKLACTACHSGPRPDDEAFQVQTALAHSLGLPSHGHDTEISPGIVAPALMLDEDVLYPHRLVWPAFWGQMQGETITPLHPETAYDALRRALRVRSGSTFLETYGKLASDDKVAALGEERAKVAEAEWTDDERAKLAEAQNAKALETFREKLVEALTELKEIITVDGAEPVYVSGGKAYRLAADGTAETFENPAAEPYAWKLAHDVRPARWSNGVKGCYECHSAGSPYFESQVTALGPAPDDAPLTRAMYELAGFEKIKLDAWNQSFQGRTAFKYFGFAAMGVVGLILLSYVLLGINGLFGLVRRS